MMHAPACLGYIRVSTEQQADEARTSLADQEAAIRQLARKLGHDVDRWYRDEGASGATVEGRPAFRELLDWCESNPRPAAVRGLVLVLNDSRFGRFPEPEEATYWRHHLYRRGWVVRFCEGDDVEGDFRGVVRAIGSVQATEYRRNLVANVRRGMRGSAEMGFWTREAPYGYRRMVVHPEAAQRVLEPGQRKVETERVKLTPHEPEARIVRWAFQAYSEGGESLGTLAAALALREPSRKWSRPTVRAMLVNDAYRGAIVGGRRRDGESELYGCENAHPPIVSRRLWDAVQRRLGLNAGRGPGVRTHYLLSGLLRCVYCGEPYTGGGGGRSRTKDPHRKHRRFYRDRGGITGSCSGRIGTVMRHLVDDATVDVLASTIAAPAMRPRIERAIDRALDQGPGAVAATEASLRAARDREERRRDRLTAAVADGTLLPAEASSQLERIRAALADIEARQQALRFRRRRARGARTERDRLLQLVLDFPARAAALTGPKLRELMEPWLATLTFDKITRQLTLGIREIPSVPILSPHIWQAPG